jgi:hypothetical protein
VAVYLHQELDNEALCGIFQSDLRIIAIAKRAPVNNCPGRYTVSLLSRLNLRFYYMTVLVKDHESMWKMLMDGHGFVLSTFLKRYIPEELLLDDVVQPDASWWNGSGRAHQPPALMDLDFLNNEFSTMTGGSQVHNFQQPQTSRAPHRLQIF